MKCTRCGGCCTQAPCAIGRIRYRIKDASKGCPGLIHNSDGTTSCEAIMEGGLDDILLVGVGCTHPEYRKAKRRAHEEDAVAESKIDKIKDTIRKCLALAGSTPYEAEAATAMAMAKDMLLKYNLTQADIDAKSGIGPDKIIEERFDIMGRFLWRKTLVHYMASRNFCTTYMFAGKYARDIVVIVGRPVNVAATKEMVSWLLPQMERIIGQESKTWEGKATSRNSYRTSFAFGMLNRINNRLYEEQQAAIKAEATTKALVVSLSGEVNGYMKETHGKMGHGTGPSVQSAVAYHDGVASGDNVSLRNYTRLTAGG